MLCLSQVIALTYLLSLFLVSYDVCEKFVFPLCEYLKNEVVYSDLPRIDAWL